MPLQGDLVQLEPFNRANFAQSAALARATFGGLAVSLLEVSQQGLRLLQRKRMQRRLGTMDQCCHYSPHTKHY
eukprot:5363673-Amphidinium_carterae.1